MEKLPPNNSPNESSNSTTLESLIKLFQGLITAVKIKNAAARKDPETAVVTMAEVCLKFPPDLIKVTVDGLKTDAEASWPTTGEMVDILQRKIRLRKQAKLGKKKTEQKQQAFRPTVKFVEIMKSPAGQRALGAGYAMSLAMDVMDGIVTLQGTDDLVYHAKRRKHLKERDQVLAELKAGDPEYASLPASVRERLIIFGENIRKRNDLLIQRYGA